MKRFFTFLAILTVYGGLNAQVYYSEDFESGNTLTLDAEWVLGTNDDFASQYFNPGDHSTFIGVNDDALGGNAPAIEGSRAVFGPVDLTDGVNPVLKFNSYFINGDYGGDETFKVYFSYEGTNYFELLDVAGIAGMWTEEIVRLDLFNGEMMYFAFEYSDGAVWNYGACVDDIVIEEYNVLNDVRLTSVSTNCGAAAVGTDVFVSGTIINDGLNNINSFDLTWTNGTTSETVTIDGLDVGFRDNWSFEHETPISMTEGASMVTFTVSNPNGMDDESVDNNEVMFELTGVPVMKDQAIVVEEATGTWCTWCPRGAVWLDRMNTCFGDNFIGVAVHNNDPMALAAYDSGLTGFPNFPGFPSVVVDRTNVMDPSELEQPTIAKVGNAPNVVLGVSADWDESTRALNVTGYADMNMSTTTGFKWVGVLTEDGVTGTGSGYDQINAYSGGGQGPMGGYENLPNPVPAAQMVYDHVGRALLAGYGGVADAGLENLSEGDQAFFDFDEITVPAEYNMENMHIIVMLIAPNGVIVNGTEVTVDAATTTSVRDAQFDHDLAKVFPNPFNDMTNIRLNLETSSEVSVSVFNTIGQVVSRKEYGSLQGDVILPFYSNNLDNGTYFIHISIDDKLVTKQVQIAK